MQNNSLYISSDSAAGINLQDSHFFVVQAIAITFSSPVSFTIEFELSDRQTNMYVRTNTTLPQYALGKQLNKCAWK